MDRVHLEFIGNASHTHFALVTWQPYCPGRPEKLCFTTPSLAVEIMGMRRGKTKLFRLPGQYGRRVIRATTPKPLLLLFIPYKFLVRMMIKFRITKENEKEVDTIKRPQQNVYVFFFQ